jgi:cytochrome c-type biogenesis protein CcmF
MGYDMTYMGFRLSGDGKDEAVINVQKNGSKICEAKTKFYWSEFNQAYMRNPSVHNLWFKDLYISPIQVIPVDESKQGELINLTEDESVYFENYTLKFAGYEMDPHDNDVDEIHVMALVNGSGPDGDFVLKPSIKVMGQDRQVIHDTFPNSDRKVHIHGVNIENRSISLMIEQDVKLKESSDAKKEMLAIEITEKPLINLLWLGTFIMIGGLVVSLKNRVAENGKS